MWESINSENSKHKDNEAKEESGVSKKLSIAGSLR